MRSGGARDRAVSETLGFVLVFTLITGTVGVVYATGITGLSDAQHAEKVQNVERAFDVLADNLDDLHQSGAPSRSTEVRLAGGSLSTGEPVTVRIRAEKLTDASVNATYTVNLEPIVYEEGDGASLIYADGAVLRSQGSGVVMVSEPGWIVGPERSVLPMINTYGSGNGIGGEGAVLIVAQRETRTLKGPFDPGPGATARVNVTVESPRAEAWQRYFERAGLVAVDSDPADGTVTYRFDTRELFVPRTGIDVTFGR